MKRRNLIVLRALSDFSALRFALAIIIAWLAILGFTSGTPSEDSAFGIAANALSIMSVGHLTANATRPLLAAWELLIALGILWPGAARFTLYLLWPRLALAVASPIMLRGDVFANFPLKPAPAGQSALLYLALLFAALHCVTRARREQLQSDKRVAPMLNELELSPVQLKDLRRRQVRAAMIYGPVCAVLGIAFSIFWPRYLDWFHARQEAAVFAENLSGQIVKKSMPLSPLLHRKITTWVYLPPGYDKLRTRYPVVYVMHGAPGEVRDCFVKGRVQDAAEELIKARKIRPMIIVGWDGQGPDSPADVTNFLDRKDGTWQMESFMTQELVPYIDRTYRTIPDARARALIGVSAGAYAAINLPFKHSDVWKIGASHTGFFRPEDDPQNMTEILGPRGPLWDENDPFKTIARLTPKDDLHIYIDMGQGDELMDEFNKLCAALETRKIDHACHVFPGRHTWEYWSEHFHDSLQFANAKFPQR